MESRQLDIKGSAYVENPGVREWGVLSELKMSRILEWTDQRRECVWRGWVGRVGEHGWQQAAIDRF